MRRLIALLVIAVLGATLYGLYNNSSGISVNGTTVSSTTVRAELAAITHQSHTGLLRHAAGSDELRAGRRRCLDEGVRRDGVGQSARRRVWPSTTTPRRR